MAKCPPSWLMATLLLAVITRIDARKILRMRRCSPEERLFSRQNSPARGWCAPVNIAIAIVQLYVASVGPCVMPAK
jgi:hypothetical protein